MSLNHRQHGAPIDWREPPMKAPEPRNGDGTDVERVMLRPLTPKDTAYIIDSFAASYRHSPDMRDVDPELYKVEIRGYIHDVIIKKRWVVACEANDQTRIAGWLCWEAPTKRGALPVLHYALVDPKWQRRGVFKAMLDVVAASAPQMPIFNTHRHHSFDAIAKKWADGPHTFIYNPLLLRYR